ncbi:hypothetical protein F4778DRAFT_788466 [Xylariomycetidae sp. FL2044]|nr:hypothetical protein F4778DRAFT_788466 [Xylariomycetidae sp. FL2044]
MNSNEAILVSGLMKLKKDRNFPNRPGAQTINQAMDWVKTNYGSHITTTAWNAAVYNYKQHHNGRTEFPTVDEDAQAQQVLAQVAASGLDFNLWAAREVEEDRLADFALPPNYNDAQGLIIYGQGGNKPSWTFRVKNAVCTKVHGQRDMLQRAENHFCRWVAEAEKIYIQRKTAQMNHELCNDGAICSLLLKETINFSNPWKENDDVGTLCHDMFAALNRACPDGGGIADAELDDGAGKKVTGQVEASFSPDDGEKRQPSESKQCLEHNEL